MASRGIASAGSGLLAELRSSIRDLGKLVNEQSEAMAKIERETRAAKREAEFASAQFTELRKGLNQKVESIVTSAVKESITKGLATKADVRIVEELRAREEALEAKVSSLQDALHESEAQRASLKRALQDGVGQLRGDLESALQKLKQHKQESVRASSEQAAQAELDRTEYRQQIRGVAADLATKADKRALELVVSTVGTKVDASVDAVQQSLDKAKSDLVSRVDAAALSAAQSGQRAAEGIKTLRASLDAVLQEQETLRASSSTSLAKHRIAETSMAEQQAAQTELRQAVASLSETLSQEKRHRENSQERSAEALRKDFEARLSASEQGLAAQLRAHGSATEGYVRDLKQGLLDRPSRSETEAAGASLRREVADVATRASALSEGLATVLRRAEGNSTLIEEVQGAVRAGQTAAERLAGRLGDAEARLVAQASEATELARQLERRAGDLERRAHDLERRASSADAARLDSDAALKELESRQAQLGEHQALSAEVLLQLREQAGLTAAAGSAASAASAANAQELVRFRTVVREVVEAMREELTSDVSRFMERTAGAVEGVQLQAEAAEARLSSAVESLRAAVAATSEEDSVLTARSQAVAAGVDATNARLVALAGAVGDLERRLEQEAAESSAEADALKETLRREHAQREAAAERAGLEAQRFRETMASDLEAALTRLERATVDAKADMVARTAPASLEGDVRAVQAEVRATAHELSKLKRKVASAFTQTGSSIHHGAAVGRSGGVSTTAPAGGGGLQWSYSHSQPECRVVTPDWSEGSGAPPLPPPYHPVVFFRHHRPVAAATASPTASTSDADDSDD